MWYKLGLFADSFCCTNQLPVISVPLQQLGVYTCLQMHAAYVCHFLISHAIQHLQVKRRAESERKKEGSVFLIHRVLSFCGVALLRSAGPPFSQY